MHRKLLWAAVLLPGILTLKMRPRTSIQSAKFGFEVCCLGHEFWLYFLFSRNQPQSLASEAVGASPAAADVQSWCPSTTRERDRGSQDCGLEVTFAGEEGKTSEGLCGECLCRWTVFSFWYPAFRNTIPKTACTEIQGRKTSLKLKLFRKWGQRWLAQSWNGKEIFEHKASTRWPGVIFSDWKLQTDFWWNEKSKLISEDNLKLIWGCGESWKLYTEMCKSSTMRRWLLTGILGEFPSFMVCGLG